MWTADWHPNQPLLAVGGTQDTLRIFSMSDYQLLSNHPIEGMITKVAWHPTRNTLAIAMQGEKSKTSIFNMDANQRIELDSIQDFWARAIGWNHNGTRLAVGDYNGHIPCLMPQGKELKR